MASAKRYGEHEARAYYGGVRRRAPGGAFCSVFDNNISCHKLEINDGMVCSVADFSSPQVSKNVKRQKHL